MGDFLGSIGDWFGDAGNWLGDVIGWFGSGGGGSNIGELIAALAGGASYSSGNRGKINWDNIDKLMQLQEGYNRPNVNGYYTSWEYDPETKSYNQRINSEGLQQGMSFMEDYMANGFDKVRLPDQFASIFDAATADEMYRRGLLDEETFPDLTQDNFGTRIGDQSPDLFNATAERDEMTVNDPPPNNAATSDGGSMRTMEFRDTNMNGIDDRDEENFSGPSEEYTNMFDSIGAILEMLNNPNNDNVAGPGGGGGSTADALSNALLGQYNMPGSQVSPVGDPNRGTPLEFMLADNAGLIGRGIGSATGIPGGGFIGDKIGDFMGDRAFGKKAWMSDGNWGGHYDWWKGEGNNPGPVQTDLGELLGNLNAQNGNPLQSPVMTPEQQQAVQAQEQAQARRQKMMDSLSQESYYQMGHQPFTSNMRFGIR
jgi:hypothetical protein